MKKKITYVLVLAAFIPAASDAQFMVVEEPAATEPVKQVLAAPVQQTAPATLRAIQRTDVAVAAPQYVPGDVSLGRMRTYIKHKGRKPAVFGRPVTSTAKNSLSGLVSEVMPESFQAFATNDVDMTSAVKGGNAQSWIEAIMLGLRDTGYTATVDWDKREVSFDLDTGNVQPVAAAAVKPVKAEKQWEVKVKDGLLSQVLSRWCKEAGDQCVRFNNQSTHDFVVEADSPFGSDFRDAVEGLMLSVKAQVGRVFKWRLSPNSVLILSDEFPSEN